MKIFRTAQPEAAADAQKVGIYRTHVQKYLGGAVNIWGIFFIFGARFIGNMRTLQEQKRNMIGHTCRNIWEGRLTLCPLIIDEQWNSQC